ncbi:MAG: DinB family protein [Anaerolineales bacterium]
MNEEIDHIRRRLADEAEKTVAYFEALPPDAWEQQIYQTGSQWRVREVLAHFISAERAYQKYLGDVLQGGSGAPDSLDIDEFNEAEVPSIKGTPAELIEKFRQVRIDTLDMTQSLDDADLTLVANHPWFEEKEIGWYLKLMYRHNTMHRMDIRKALSAGQPITPTDEHRTGRQVNSQ